MELYFLKLTAIPTAAAAQAADIRYATAAICVMARSQNHALLLAKQHLMDYGWLPGEVDTSERLPRAQLAQLGTPLAAVAVQALEHGIGMLLAAVPKVERDPHDAPAYRSLTPPAGGSGSVN